MYMQEYVRLTLAFEAIRDIAKSLYKLRISVNQVRCIKVIHTFGVISVIQNCTRTYYDEKIHNNMKSAPNV